MASSSSAEAPSAAMSALIGAGLITSMVVAAYAYKTHVDGKQQVNEQRIAKLEQIRLSERRGRVNAEKALREARHALMHYQATSGATVDDATTTTIRCINHHDAAADDDATVADTASTSNNHNESDSTLTLDQQQQQALDSAESASKPKRQRRKANTQQQSQRANSSSTSTTQSLLVHTNEFYTFHPIGVLQSVYKKRVGTPRQGLVVMEGRGRLALLSQASDALHGLADFSHCWLIFVFHNNTNTHKTSVKSKVHPPRMSEARASVGVFGTRSPHRPSAIGISICRIDKVVGSVVHLSGIDLIDGTPVLDIKPYVHGYDDMNDLHQEIKHNAPWLQWNFARFDVHWQPSAIEFVDRFYNSPSASKLDGASLYASSAEAQAFITSVLSTDIRPAHRHKQIDVAFRAPLDAFIVEYVVNADSLVTITDVQCATSSTDTTTAEEASQDEQGDA
jgi:tRNA-Thr(GGU) m(6)t(6)A37 methyltransferase TsaA